MPLLLPVLLCACLAPVPQVPGRISVEVYQGLAGKAAGSFLPAIELIVDATRSMQAPATGAVTHLQAAQAKATELLHSLPAGSQVGLHVLGARSGTARCAPAERRAAPLVATDPALRESLDGLRAGAEGSLADTLAALTAELRSQRRARDARVVLLTDLDASCGGDLCAAAEELIAAGAWLDVVVLGDAPAPACLSGLRPSAEEPGALVRALTRPVPVWYLAVPGAATGARAVAGSAGMPALDAPAGEWLVGLELERPAVAGPLLVEPGRLTRVRVHSFAGGPPRFAWEIVDERR